MRDLLVSTCPACILAIAIVEIVLTVYMLRMYKRTKSIYALGMALLTMGLVLDALVIDLGVIYTGALLKPISRLRYICHGVLVPFLFPFSAHGLKLSEKVMKIVWGVTAVIMAAGLAANLTLGLEAEEVGIITRYVEMEGSPAWVEAISGLLTFGAVIPLIICGIIVWVKKKIPHMFLSGLFMFAFSALGPATGNFDMIFYISMYGELLMVLFFYLYERKREKTAEEK